MATSFNTKEQSNQERVIPVNFNSFIPFAMSQQNYLQRQQQQQQQLQQQQQNKIKLAQFGQQSTSPLSPDYYSTTADDDDVITSIFL